MLLLNDKKVDYFIFPGGEIQVKIPTEIKEERVTLTWRPTQAVDIMRLMLTANALQESGIHDIDLDILYLPYARQDRVCAHGEAFSLKAICEFIDQIKVTAIRIWDVHNKKVINRLFCHPIVHHVYAWNIFARYKILNNFNPYKLILCAPDKGAEHRVQEIVNHFTLPSPVYLSKYRNPSTGAIESIIFQESNRYVVGVDVMVVDDICDGGSTFIKAAECLKEQGAESLYLYVTHGIFSRGLDELLKHYKHIYCHHVLDDYTYQSNENLTILREFPHAS